MKKKFETVMWFLINSGLFAVGWHFIDVYGVDYTWSMPANLLLKLFLSYLGVKVVIILAGIFALYHLVIAICRWRNNRFQKAMDVAVEKALAKHL